MKAREREREMPQLSASIGEKMKQIPLLKQQFHFSEDVYITSVLQMKALGKQFHGNGKMGNGYLCYTRIHVHRYRNC